MSDFTSVGGYVFAPWVDVCYILTVMKLSRLVVTAFTALTVPAFSVQNDAAANLPQPVEVTEEEPLGTHAHQEALVNRAIIQLVEGIYDKATADAAAAQMAIYVEISEALSAYREPENWIFSDEVFTSARYDEYVEGAEKARAELFRAFFYGSTALAKAVAGDEDYATVPTKAQCRIAHALVGQMRGLTAALEQVKDHDSAVAMAPAVAALNCNINTMLEKLDYPAVARDVLFASVGWSREEDTKLSLEKQVLFGAFYHSCPELALALGGREMDARRRTDATSAQLLRIGEMIATNSSRLADALPNVSGGPGLSMEQSWVVNSTGDSALQTVEKVLARLLPDATLDSYVTCSDYENTWHKRACTMLMTMDGSLVSFNIWFDLTAYYSEMK